MFRHPFYVTIGLSLLLSFFNVIFFKKSLFAFISQFISFPYWAVLLIFVFFSIIRSIRETRAYKLLHTIYHERGVATTHSSLNFTAQPDEFGLS